MNPPALDRSIGIEVYSTQIAGIGGRIKQTPDQFVVEEMLDNSSLDLVERADEEHAYPLYLLQKEGIDSRHAVREVELATGLRLKIVGLKDAKAITRQYASVIRKQQNAKSKLVTKHCMLDLLGYTRKPITKGKLVANIFAITINDFEDDGVEKRISELQGCIDNNTIANFYGYQRFGSSRPVTHLVGKEMIKRNFRQAVELLLCYSTEYESKESREIRELCRDSSNFPSILKILPTQMDLERMLIIELMKSNDPIKAIRRLPITIRRLFVQAYQSYIFNRSLSMAIKERLKITSPEQKDICFCFEPNNFKMMRISRFDNNADALEIPAIPLAGFAFRDDNRFGSIVKKVMDEEGVSKKDFYIKEMQEVSAEGGFRQVSLLCKEFSYKLNESLQVQFTLSKGCYATVLLRELMKPSDPITVGF